MADDALPQNQQPSVDPPELDTLVGAFRFILKKHLQNTDDMLPAKIITYDRTLNMATVQPMIKVVSTNNQLLTRAPLAKIPVFSLGGGGWHVNFPLVEGSLGWIKACDRDISLYLQAAYAESPPNTYRLHTFSDGMFFPDVMADYTIAEDDAENMVIQSTDGAVKISLGSGFINIEHPTTVTVTTALAELSAILKVGGAFGCNGATPQTPATIQLATGANNTTVINEIRAALIANGIGQ